MTDTILTITQQLPINRAVQAIDLSHFDAERVQQLRDITIQHFHLRGLLSVTAFVWLVGAVAFFARRPASGFSGGNAGMKRLCVVIVLLVLFASFGSSPLAAQKDVAGGPMRQ